MIHYSKTWVFTLILVLSISFACSTDNDKKLWDETVKVNTTTAYQSYLTQFPDGKYSVEANDKVQDLIFQGAESSTDATPFYDDYVKTYVNGKYIDEFETIIYGQAKKKNTLEAFEKYASRFPSGKYLNEVEMMLYEGILTRESKMTLMDYLIRFPESNYKGDIEQMMFDSLLVNKSMAAADTFLVFFPEGQHTEEVKLMLEDISYKNTVNTNANYSFNTFINKFPGSTHIKKMVFDINPSDVNLKILDSKSAIIFEGIPIDTFSVIEHTSISFVFEKEGFQTINRDYIVSTEAVQIISSTMKPHVSYVYQNDFSKTGSPFLKTAAKSNFELYDNNKLYCKTKQQQFQILNSFNIDFGKDFIIEVKFKFINSPNYSKSYFGIIWGSDNNTRYYFATIDGRLSLGDQENNLRSVENDFGYTKWSSEGGKNDTWSAYNYFRQNDDNVLRIEKSGKTYIYTLNGTVYYRDKVISRSSGDKVGFGIGSAEVLVDYFNIMQ